MTVFNIEEPFAVDQIKKMLKKDSIIICSKENKNKYKKVLSEIKIPYFISVLTLEELFKKETSELEVKLEFLKIITENKQLKNLNLFKIEILDELFEIYKERRMNELIRTNYTSEILDEVDFVIKNYEEKWEDITKFYDKDIELDEDIFIVDVFFETKKEISAISKIQADKKIFLYGSNSKFVKKMQTELNLDNGSCIEKKQKETFCFSANDPYEELLIVVNKIEKIKRENNLSYDDFAICSTNLDQYIGYLDLIFNANNLNYNLPKEINNNLIDKVLNIIDKSTNIYEDVLLFLQNNENEDTKTILNLVDNYFEVFEKEELLKELLKKMKKQKILVEYNNSIDIIDFSKLLNTNYKYIFFLGASEGSLSYKYSKKVLLNDIEKTKAYLDYDTVKKINKFELQLFDLENRAFSVSYHKVNNEKAKQSPSHLIKNEEKITLDDYKYLVNSLKIKLSKSQEIPNLDKKIKKANNILKTKKLNKEFSSIKLSASKTENFNNCHFSYFCNYDLNLRTFEEKFDLAFIGNLIHKLFEASFSEENDLESVKNNFSKNLNTKETFLLEKIYASFPQLYEKIEKELLDNKYIVEKREYNIKEDPLLLEGDKLEIELTGIIDRIDVKDNFVRIVDYKTGNVKIDLDAYLSGLKMQLFIYMLYASSKLDKKVAGIFYQKAFLDSEKEEDLKKYLLNGIILNDDKVIESMGGDNIDNYLNIKSYAKIDLKKAFSEKIIKKINKHTEKLLLETGENILSGKIDINPYKDPESCKFCDYSSICGIEKNSRIFRKIEKKDFLEVVGDNYELDE